MMDEEAMPSDLQKAPPKADIRVPKGHAMMKALSGVAIGTTVSARLSGKVTAASIGRYPGDGGEVCIELDDISFKKIAEPTMVDDMKEAAHKKRSSFSSEDEEEY